jgi:hypothetical protein
MARKRHAAGTRARRELVTGLAVASAKLELGTADADLRSQRMTVSAEKMLVKCLKCGAWPMVLVGKEHDHFAFQCPKCRAVSFYTVGADGNLIPGADGG